MKRIPEQEDPLIVTVYNLHEIYHVFQLNEAHACSLRFTSH